MKPFERAALPLVGLLGFLALWQLVVVVTRPAIIFRSTIAFSAPSQGGSRVVILDRKGHVVASEPLPLDVASRETAVAKLRLWLGSMQPTTAALPDVGTDELRPLLEKAKEGYGGGLDVRVVPGAASSDPVRDAETRGKTLQLATSVRPTWLPNPIEAITALVDMTRSGEMVRHVVASLFRVATGFVLATVLGVPFGLALGSFARLSATANVVIQCLRPISPIAWLPVATLALGGGDLAAIFLIFLSSFFPIAVSTAAAVGTVDQKYLRSAQNFGVLGLASLRLVIFPAALPAILTALRIALGISWVVVVAAEMLGVESGLGYLVLDARNQLRYDRVVAAMIVIGLIGLLIDHSVRNVEQTELARRGLAR